MRGKEKKKKKRREEANRVSRGPLPPCNHPPPGAAARISARCGEPHAEPRPRGRTPGPGLYGMVSKLQGSPPLPSPGFSYHSTQSNWREAKRGVRDPLPPRRGESVSPPPNPLPPIQACPRPTARRSRSSASVRRGRCQWCAHTLGSHCVAHWGH